MTVAALRGRRRALLAFGLCLLALSTSHAHADAAVPDPAAPGPYGVRQFDYKAGQLYADLRAATPGGIDGYFDNVGGETLDAVLRRMNAFGRVAVCGLIAGYDGQPLPINEFRSVLINRLKVQGFIVSEHPQYWPPAQRQLAELVGSGQMKYRETVAQGLDAAPEAFIGLLKGRNFGKQLVRLVEAA